MRDPDWAHARKRQLAVTCGCCCSKYSKLETSRAGFSEDSLSAVFNADWSATHNTWRFFGKYLKGLEKEEEMKEKRTNKGETAGEFNLQILPRPGETIDFISKKGILWQQNEERVYNEAEVQMLVLLAIICQTANRVPLPAHDILTHGCIWSQGDYVNQYGCREKWNTWGDI